MTRWLAALLLLASACEKKQKDADVAPVLCTTIGCSSGVELKIGNFAVADVTPTASATARIEVCLNKQCAPLALKQLPSKAAAVFLDGVIDPKVSTSATIDVAPPDMISVGLEVQGEAEAFKDGDVYHVTVKSADNRVLSDRSWSVDTYRLTQPNGPQCGPTCAQPKTLTEMK